MAKRTVKTLNKTGRITRKKASAAASVLRESLPKPTRKAKISKTTTASGRAKIAFHVSGTLSRAKATESDQRQLA
jgi:hypothetical protein